MSGPMAPWWQETHRAAQLLASTVGAAVTRAGESGVYESPPGTPPPRRRRQPASLRHLAEVIRTHRLAPGLSVDKDIVAGVLAGDLKHVTDPTAVVAVARAAHRIAGTEFTDTDAERLTVACAHVAELAARAREADETAGDRVPVPLETPIKDEKPVIDAYFTTRPPRRRRLLIAAGLAVATLAGAAGAAVALSPGEGQSDGGTPDTAASAPDADCLTGASGNDVIPRTPEFFADDAATRLSPTLDFDAMNGSARYARHEGRTYYWGRAGSDDQTPHSGGSRVRWRIADGPWRSCATPLPQTERGYVHSPAVATTIGGQAVTLQVCLWRDSPFRENCTTEIATG
ncbi:MULTISPECIES: hypothetical protein [Actinoplanes]|uniref:hypothetical protein n=1 Tax=Actinoplanes TaxID=1865 RepID=UPI000AFE0056|nr:MULTISPECIES: hypothetical protein [Actinoplanes]GLY00248.1 hypothetical protein Acsp01_06270 [Actinoplanes sp. NBRC 101535]